MSWEQPQGKLAGLTASADLSAKQYLFVKPSGDDTVTVAALASNLLLGILQNKPASGAAAEIVNLGVSKLKIGGTVTAGDRITSDATGKGIKATTGTDVIGAIAINGGVSGDIISVLVITGVPGGASGLRTVAGQATTVAASDTIVTGLGALTAVVAVLDDDPVAGCQFVTASIGNQAGAPAAGSFLLKTWKDTATADTAKIAATTFTKKVNWIAVGI